MRKEVLLITTTIILSFALIYVLFYHKRNQIEASSIQVITVTSEKPELKVEPITFATIAIVQAIHFADLSFNQSGHILSILKPDGAHVKKGEPLIKLSTSVLMNDIKERQKAYKLAQAQLERMEKLAGKNMVSQAELDVLTANVISEEAILQQLNKKLDECTLHAPIDGKLSFWKVHIGEEVTLAQQLNSIVKQNELVLTYSLPENLYTKTQLGQSVNVYNSNNTLLANATVNFISPTVDSVTHTILLKANIEKIFCSLLNGQTVNIRQQLSSGVPQIWISAQSIVSDIKGYSVFKIIDGSVKKQEVIIGKRQSNQVEILKGLTVNDIIVKDGAHKLYNSAKVMVNNNYNSEN